MISISIQWHWRPKLHFTLCDENFSSLSFLLPFFFFYSISATLAVARFCAIEFEKAIKGIQLEVE